MRDLKVHELTFSDPRVFSAFIKRLPDPPTTMLDYEMKMLFSLRIIAGRVMDGHGPYVSITLSDRQKKRFDQVMEGRLKRR